MMESFLSRNGTLNHAGEDLWLQGVQLLSPLAQFYFPLLHNLR